MDGSTRRRCSPLAVQREFVGFRLEKQTLVRVYELVVPLLMPASAPLAVAPQRPAPMNEKSSILPPLGKGA
jgi:hypothetical protein